MKTRSIVRWTLLVTLVLPLLAVGCAATGEPEPAGLAAEIEAPTEAPEPIEQPAETETTVEGPTPSGKVTFITHAGTPFEVMALTQAVEEFMVEHPDIEVVCMIVNPPGEWAAEGASPCTFVPWR